MLVNAGTFAVVALAALLLRAAPLGAAAAGAEPDRARDGIVFLFRDRTLGSC